SLGGMRVEHTDTALVRRWTLECDDVNDFSMILPAPDVRERFLVRVTADDGITTQLMDPGSTWSVDTPMDDGATGGGVWATYFVLGVEHIATGFDHLLFVLCLLLLVRRLRTLLVTITAFTLAHSVTLG